MFANKTRRRENWDMLMNVEVSLTCILTCGPINQYIETDEHCELDWLEFNECCSL